MHFAHSKTSLVSFSVLPFENSLAMWEIIQPFTFILLSLTTFMVYIFALSLYSVIDKFAFEYLRFFILRINCSELAMAMLLTLAIFPSVFHAFRPTLNTVAFLKIRNPFTFVNCSCKRVQIDSFSLRTIVDPMTLIYITR